ncbi:phosphotransferase [Sanguibacter sp. Z1732]|uniref:phosphotransferase n=1 Tax=Sanguibacter sp. Z1732 TaxID=3435412 RepID=UPI003D9C9140
MGISGDLSVSRIWPRGAGRVSLELLGPAGELLAGQMIEDDGDRRRVMAATSGRARAGGDVVLAPALDGRGATVGTVLVQARGADRRLQALPHLLTEPGSHLLVHRPERRAVVYLPGGPEVVAGAGAPDQASGAGTYARVFRAGRTAAVVRSARLGVHVLGGLPGFAAPGVVEHREGGGVVVTSALPGESLRALLGTEQAAAMVRAGAAGLGHLLRHLARAPVPGDLPVRDAAAELAWVGVWIERVRQHLPRVHPRLPAGLELIADHLDRRPATGTGIIHGDLHDGQVLISRTPTGRTPTGPALDDATASVGVCWTGIPSRSGRGRWMPPTCGRTPTCGACWATGLPTGPRTSGPPSSSIGTRPPRNWTGPPPIAVSSCYDWRASTPSAPLTRT